MTRWTGLILGLLALFCPAPRVAADVVEVGSAHVTRYAVEETDAGDLLIATGELVEGDTPDVRLALAGQGGGLHMTLAQARGVHELLGHMLAVTQGQTPDTPSEPTGNPPDDTPTVSDDIPTNRPRLGMNLSDVTYYTRAWVFTDLMLQSDAWRDSGSGHIFKSGYAPQGAYIATWAGSGNVSFSGDASAQPTGPNSASVTVSEGQRGIDMRKSGEVYDVHLIRLEHEMRTSPFQPEFLHRLKPFGVIRFMDWQNTNGSNQEHWADRPHKGQITQAGRDGVALEYMIALCNELRADPWFCMPHKADDDYIRQFAEMVRDRLHPDAKVYIEYSNEVWNSQFGQHDYIKRVSGGETYSDRFFDAWADRCRNTFAIWSNVFGEQADDRLVRVAAVHLQNPWIAKKLLERMDGQFDAVAPAGYFGITRKQGKKLTAATTVDQVLDLCQQNILDDNADWYQAHAEHAKAYSDKLGRPIRLITYEAGQHLSANGDEGLPYYDALIEAQSHPRIYGLYLLNMRMFDKAGGDLFCAFNDVSKPGKFGSWGHLEYQDQPTSDAPKYRALLEYPWLQR